MSNTPFSDGEPAPQVSQLAESDDGVILQRGGEELMLEKAADRFSLRPTSPDPETLAQLREEIKPISIQPVALGELQEWLVSQTALESALESARQSPAIAFASHVYRLKLDQTWIYMTDQITVQFAPRVSPPTIKAIAAQLGLVQTAVVEGIPQTFVFEVTKTAIANPIKLANQLMRQPEVLTAEPDVVMQRASLHRPADNLYGQQWHLNHTGGDRLAPNSHISVESAWDITRGSRSVVIAIVDDGFDLNHPDFQGPGKLVAPKDFKDKDALPMPNQKAENHGTAVAGLAIAEENGAGVVGVAPGCAFMPIKFPLRISDASIEQMFKWAVDQGASVISCSWAGAARYDTLNMRQRTAIKRAATQGRNGKGCVILFAAGNANRPLRGDIIEKGWPNNSLQGKQSWMNGYAIHPDVIAVSASTSLNRKAAYSNWGKEVSVAAPSDNGMHPRQGADKTGPQIATPQPGRGLLTSDRVGRDGYVRDGLADYVQGFGGTSSACPVAAGVVGLMLSANPDLTAKEVKQILQETADKIVDATPDPQLGLRYGDYRNGGHSLWFGYGKVNAFKAVQAAQRRRKTRRLSRTVKGQSNRAVNIPDDDPKGALSPIRINHNGSIQDIQVRVDIEHSFLGDIALTLIAPNNREILLQGRTLGRRTQLKTIYTLTTTPSLSYLIHQPASGQWRLKAVDFAPDNRGKIKGWELVIGV